MAVATAPNSPPAFQQIQAGSSGGWHISESISPSVAASPASIPQEMLRPDGLQGDGSSAAAAHSVAAINAAGTTSDTLELNITKAMMMLHEYFLVAAVKRNYKKPCGREGSYNKN